MGDRLRLTAQLINTGDGAMLWAEKFEEQFTHIFAIQNSISEQVAHTLALRLSSEQRRQLIKHATADTDAYQQLLVELYELTKQCYVSPFYLALAHIGLGEVEKTCAALQQAYLDRFEWLVQFRVDPVWDSLHSDPRFADMLCRLGLA